MQNDYSIRCLPQIFWPRFGVIFDQFDAINRELDAVTDNPLIFKGCEITPDVNPERILQFENESWLSYQEEIFMESTLRPLPIFF